jgi:hypothetical protein
LSHFLCMKRTEPKPLIDQMRCNSSVVAPILR